MTRSWAVNRFYNYQISTFSPEIWQVSTIYRGTYVCQVSLESKHGKVVHCAVILGKALQAAALNHAFGQVLYF